MMTINNQSVATVNAIHDSKAQIFLDEKYNQILTFQRKFRMK